MSVKGLSAFLSLAVITCSVGGAQAMGGAQGSGAAQTTADAGLAPFSAHYLADWKSINVGTSDLDLKPDAEPEWNRSRPIFIRQ